MVSPAELADSNETKPSATFWLPLPQRARKSRADRSVASSSVSNMARASPPKVALAGERAGDDEQREL